MPEHQQIQQSKEPDTSFQKQATPVIQTPLSNPYSIIQRAKINPKSLTHADIMQLQRTIGNRAVGRLLPEIRRHPSIAQQTPVQRQEIPEEEEPSQGKTIEIIQRQEIPEEEGSLQTKKENNTGMPDNLKAGVENLSGIDMSNVRVHYNSYKPAGVGALAYTQGTDIHVAPGQERYLPHEAWHVVQQAQGRVKPTMQLKDLAVNDDEGLEHEADIMGKRATAVSHITTPLQFSLHQAGLGQVHTWKQLTHNSEESLKFLSSTRTIATHSIQQIPALQRMIEVNNNALYVNSKESGLDTKEKKDSWINGLTELRNIKKGNVWDISPEDFFGLKKIETKQDELRNQLNDCHNIFTYPYDNALYTPDLIDNTEKIRLLQPADILLGKNDLQQKYEISKACVLQALVNAGIENPKVKNPKDPASWHDYCYNKLKIRYDEDIGAFKIYTDLGLELVMNEPATWNELKLTPGTYIFSSVGHNFCVVVNEEIDPNRKYICHDEPQRKQLRYQGDLKIKYIWKKP